MALGQSLVTHHFSPPLFLLLTSSRIRLPPVSCSSSRDAPFTEQDVLRFVAESREPTLPCIRTYENDLSRLSLVGAVSFDQALTAAAADGGRAAAEHVDSGLDAMVVETMFPEPNDEHASISTRLFLPAQKVEEKAAQLRKSLSQDIFSGEGLRDILAMTFRQVVLHKLWNFELFIFRPGTERNMAEIVNGREVPVSFSLSSSDEHVITLLAEVVCVLALQSTEKHFVNDLLETNSSNFFWWLRKPERIVSKDSSVAVHKLFDEEIVENAKILFKSFTSKESFKSMKMCEKNQWWIPSVQSKLEKIGGPEFSAWASEYVPAYRLQIDSSRLKDLKFKGWKKLAMNRWEVLLTHCQMLGLANILDIYFEDIFTLPGKQVGCSTVESHKSLSNKKSISSLLKFLSATLASGVLLVTLGLFGQLCLPHLSKGGKFPGQYWTLSTTETRSATRVSTDSEKLESACVSTIRSIKDCLRWPGGITMETSFGTWIGEVPDFLRMSHQVNCSSDEMLTDSADSMKSGAAMEKSSAQEVASFQERFPEPCGFHDFEKTHAMNFCGFRELTIRFLVVHDDVFKVVLSTDGKIIGFQPTSRVGVNNWAVNPLTRELYGGRKLSPGFLEPGLNTSLPDEIVVIEILMSVNSDAFFAFARPVQ